MTRRVVIRFDVDDDAAITDQDLVDMIDQWVSTFDPDPPVLTYDGAEIRYES